MEGTELESCLLQWVRSFEEIGDVQSLESLDDGLVLWKILREIDADYFAGDLPEPQVNKASDWTRKWQNLKHLERQVSMYYRDIASGQEQITVDSLPDVKAIAAEASTAETEKLIMVIIRAAMASPESNQKMAQRLMSLGRENAMLIANELRSMEEAEYTESEPASRDESAYHSEHETLEEPKTNGNKVGDEMYQDPLLEREEQLLQAQATIEKMEARHVEAQRQLDGLRQDKERLEEAFDTYRNEIDTKGRKSVEDDASKRLQRQVDNDRAYIDELEAQLQSSRAEINKYEFQLQQASDGGDLNQKLKDEVQLLKADNEELNHKVKANENLKKKIQALQEHERTNATLREEVKQANERLTELDRLKRIQANLEKEIIEKQGLIRNQEYQINELTTTRKHAEYEARVLQQKLQDARDRHSSDHDLIQELKAGLQDGTATTQANEISIADSEQEEPPKIQPSRSMSTDDESKHLNEKIILLQQQLETQDVRLKQVTERNATLEEQQQNVESGSDDLQKAEAQLSEHENTIASLRKDLEGVSKQKAEAPKLPQDLASLQRENHLMATAWYDLSSRLQNNGVSLTRRRQEPKSWIGKQRALVGPSTAPVSLLRRKST